MNTSCELESELWIHGGPSTWLEAAYHLGRLLNLQEWVRWRGSIWLTGRRRSLAEIAQLVDRATVKAAARDYRKRVEAAIHRDREDWIAWCDSPGGQEQFAESLHDDPRISESQRPWSGRVDELADRLKKILPAERFAALRFGITLDQGVRRVRRMKHETLAELFRNDHITSSPQLDSVWFAKLQDDAPSDLAGAVPSSLKEMQDLVESKRITAVVAQMDTDVRSNARRKAVADRLDGQRPEPKPGYLELVIDPNAMTIERKGYPAQVELSKNRWSIFISLYGAKGNELPPKAQESWKGEPSAARYQAVSDLRKKLRPLGITITKHPYRLIGLDNDTSDRSSDGS